MSNATFSFEEVSKKCLKRSEIVYELVCAENPSLHGQEVWAVVLKHLFNMLYHLLYNASVVSMKKSTCQKCFPDQLVNHTRSDESSYILICKQGFPAAAWNQVDIKAGKGSLMSTDQLQNS